MRYSLTIGVEVQADVGVEALAGSSAEAEAETSVEVQADAEVDNSLANCRTALIDLLLAFDKHKMKLQEPVGGNTKFPLPARKARICLPLYHGADRRDMRHSRSYREAVQFTHLHDVEEGEFELDEQMGTKRCS